MPIEKDVISGVKERLKIWEFHKVCLWWERLNSGRIKTAFGTWIQMCQENTPDFVAVIKNKENNLSVIWFECKRPGEHIVKHSGQDEFRNRFKGVKDIHHFEIDNPKMVDIIISDLGINRLNELPDDVK